MTKRTRRNHAQSFKAKVTLAALKGEKTLTELAQLYDVYPNQITTWKAQLAAGAAGLFGGAPTTAAAPAVDLKSLHVKIGELTLENYFLSGALSKAWLLSAKRRLTATTNCRCRARRRCCGLAEAACITRRGRCRRRTLGAMRRSDELHLNYPFAGSRMLRDFLRAEGVDIGRKKVTAMMRRMEIKAVYRRPNTLKPAPGHKVYPYLLRGMKIERPNHVWAMDITYIPMARGFVYLAAVVDWFSRQVLAWRLSITLEVEFCLEAVEEALARHGTPEIFNTDQGSQFTSAAFTARCRKPVS